MEALSPYYFSLAFVSWISIFKASTVLVSDQELVCLEPKNWHFPP